eukprot:TRINITY_DN672_c0_g3_i2.p1 TRINITY_DN672_c0_g3~~TRINITY_DN672_c0_g3_i2.p1  ORF type:complete len:165 (-),score=25.78 TRINITY_DN672_c0_g3_i2:37-480(-)
MAAPQAGARVEDRAGAGPIVEDQAAQPAGAPPQPARRSYINLRLIAHLVLVVFLFSQEGEPTRTVVLAIMAAFYYLYQVGLLGGNQARPAGLGDDDEDVDPAVVEEFNRRQEAAARPIEGGLLKNMERFVVGLFCSLFPSWQPQYAR